MDYIPSNTISGASNSLHHKTSESFYREKWNNENLKIILCSISTDKTELSKGSKRQAWPVYLTIMNFHKNTLKENEVSTLIGFIPKLSYSDEKIKEFMKKCHITTKSSQKSALTVLNRYVESTCLGIIIKPIIEANKNGPMKLFIGTKEYDTMPVFHTFIGKLLLNSYTDIRV